MHFVKMLFEICYNVYSSKKNVVILTYCPSLATSLIAALAVSTTDNAHLPIDGPSIRCSRIRLHVSFRRGSY